ncbi:MAG: exodeoxyribonuclease III [Desulfovibrionaceae bacterium]|jgi:exodeoxyribonuclease-3|nr:exodeoxyribonuclease III [Desulfovibrionaceae bacterium]
MLLYSWNVNGFRAVAKKGFWDWFNETRADVVSLQETKAHPDQIAEPEKYPDGYASHWNACKTKKGYSGTCVFFRDPQAAPLTISEGLPDAAYQGEGRCIHLEYEKFHFFNIYFPNGQKDDERLAYKLGYYDAFLAYAEQLRKSKPIVVCGDFNTAHKEIDLARPKENRETSGFLPIECAWLDTFTNHGYLDTFRLFEPGPDHYTWWTYRFGARERNVGWRIDYFFVSKELRPNVKRAWIESDVMGSDHCPLGLELEF